MLVADELVKKCMVSLILLTWLVLQYFYSQQATRNMKNIFFIDCIDLNESLIHFKVVGC